MYIYMLSNNFLCFNILLAEHPDGILTTLYSIAYVGKLTELEGEKLEDSLRLVSSLRV